MATLRSNVPDLYTPVFDELVLESYGEETMVSTQVFDVKTDDSEEVQTSSISALGMWEETGEGEPVDFEDMVQGYDQTFTHLKYTKAFQVTFEALDDDEYAVLKKEDDVKAMGRGARARVEHMCAMIFARAFNSDYTGADGVPLCSNSHPKNPEETGTTYDNYITNAFSHDALETMESQIASQMRDSKGLIVEVPEQPLLVHPWALKGDVERTLDERAKERPATANRDINRFAGVYTPVTWRYLDIYGSTSAWFVVYRHMGLRFYWRERPHFRSWIDEGNEMYCFKGRMRCIAGWNDWRGVWGSDGTT